ncbi:DUF4038 domain-containing protein [Actinopolymorpha sp. B11F2]|uniref:apiosidase-like domain-containing protein n=1 Tax=Actinopolymorpha sp. B11F2 TaxID=3160862 RepID=UPI0032E3F98B
MKPLATAPTGDHFLADGSPVVPCADTVWAAFTDARPDEWESYLSLRRSQGFDTMLISVLPILHDRSVHETTREPYPLRDDGTYDFTAPDGDYFTAAQEMVERAAEQGIRAALVALWCTYVPGTWGSDRNPHAVMSQQETADYLELLTRTFHAYDPIYIASGDDKFATPEAVERYAWTLGQLAKLAPDCLTTLHSTPDTDLPATLADSPDLDFYSYQSGHGHGHQAKAYDLAELYLGKPVRRPVVNLEPCYEGHGYGQGLGRFTRDDVRRATWWSLLGGASAGIGYGAHGLWGWHRPGSRFTSGAWSGEPFTWDVALHLDGAWDVGFARSVVEDHGLYRCAPRQDLIATSPPGVRVAATPDLATVAVYVPHPFDVELGVDLGGYAVTAWDLGNRRRVTPALGTGATGTVLRQPAYLSDTVYLLSG